MNVIIYNNQKDISISKACVQKQVRIILKKEKINCKEVTLHFVEEKEIKYLHKKYFDDSSFTDCISFPIDSPGENCIVLGEIFICAKAALKYAKKNKLDPFDELSLYIAHGLLHLMGYDDILKKDIMIMRNKEKQCMELIKARKAGINTKHNKRLATI